MSNREGRSEPGSTTGEAASSGGGAPGKRTLTQSVQRKAGGAPAAAGPAGGEAASGAAGPGPDVAAAKAAAIVERAMARKRAQQGGADPAAAAGEAPAGEGASGDSAASGGPVQMDGDGARADPDTIHAAAADGVGGAAGRLPFADAIQQSFGGHDVSGVRAHVGGAAAEACATMGASAYASGSDVAFASSPDLHTAAHEAAHVVQQRGGVHLYGGVGETGDVYERNADAVADRVVAGASADDLLTPFAGGASTPAVQRSAVPAASATPMEGPGATGGGATTAAAGGTGTSHYVVELKAWIPHDKVVDPEEPARASDWLDSISGVVDSVLDSMPFSAVGPRLKYDFHSYYRGDNHAGYDGGHRVISKAEFDFDGTTVSSFKHTGNAHASHRDYDYRAWIEFLYGLASIEVTSGAGSESATAGGSWSGATAGPNSFDLGFASANPLVMTWAPDIDSTGHGTLGSGLTFSYNTDLFPSHGVRVYKNGSAVETKVVNDASGVNGLGPIGAALIGHRLTSQTNAGSITVP